MANQNKLKAYVRYDGTGRVIAGGPILQRFKPAVGNWVEIDASECCNYVPTTTTTTTQGGGVTPTAWIGYMATSNSDACNQIDGSTIILYTSTPTIVLETIFYVDPALTQVYSGEGGYLNYNIGGTLYNIYGFGGANPGAVAFISSCSSYTTTTTTTTTTAFVGTYYVAGPNAEVCGGTGPYSLPLIVDPNACSNGGIVLAVGTYADYGITNGSVIYINLQNGNVIQVQTFGSSQMSFGCTSCG